MNDEKIKKFSDLKGIVPDITGDESSEEYVARLRSEEYKSREEEPKKDNAIKDNSIFDGKILRENMRAIDKLARKIMSDPVKMRKLKEFRARMGYR